MPHNTVSLPIVRFGFPLTHVHAALLPLKLACTLNPTAVGVHQERRQRGRAAEHREADDRPQAGEVKGAVQRCPRIHAALAYRTATLGGRPIYLKMRLL